MIWQVYVYGIKATSSNYDKIVCTCFHIASLAIERFDRRFMATVTCWLKTSRISSLRSMAIRHWFRLLYALLSITRDYLSFIYNKVGSLSSHINGVSCSYTDRCQSFILRIIFTSGCSSILKRSGIFQVFCTADSKVLQMHGLYGFVSFIVDLLKISACMTRTNPR